MKKKLTTILLLTLLPLNSQLYATTTPTNTTWQCPNNNPYHILVNKQNSLSTDYIPSNLVIPNVTFQSPGNIQKNYMEKTAAKALEEMFAAAKAQGIRLVAVSGYRSYSRQSVLYKNAVANSGINQMGTAKPGQSEHQTGLAMDINSISQSFEHTKEGKWLAQNAHLYGYIIRYPKGKTDITGYIYEPWHIRYVGKELAAYCFANNLTLEEITHCCDHYEDVNSTIQSPAHPDGSDYLLLRINGVTYIKARDLISSINGHLNLEQPLLTLYANDYTLSLTAQSFEAILNNQNILLTHEPMLINNTYYLPMREVLNLLGYQLTYTNADTLVIS